MVFTTPQQALTFVSKNLQAITETLSEPQEDACKYIAAWAVSKQGNRDIQTITNVLKYFSRNMDSGSEFVSLDDVLESDAFELGEFYDDDEESDRYALEFKKNQERLGLYLD
jgi:hypothetical protein